MEVGAVEDGSRLIRTDKAVVFRDIVGVVGPGGAAREARPESSKNLNGKEIQPTPHTTRFGR